MSQVYVLVAGEASGDQLGAALIRAILAKDPAVRFTGIGGPLMKAEGMDCWWDTSELSVMGLVEVLAPPAPFVQFATPVAKPTTQIESRCLHRYRRARFQSWC